MKSAHQTKKNQSEVSQPHAAGSPPLTKRISPNVAWALVTGLAVGFAVARELGPRSGAGHEESAAADAPAAPSAAPSPSAPAAPSRPGGPVKMTLTDTMPRKGPKDPKVTLVEISDFQCPFCSRAVPTLKEIEEKYAKEVTVVFVNQPLSFHNHAMEAALAAHAAFNQKKFFEMHDKLFANQQNLSRPDLEKYAGELGLNMDKFKKDMDDPKTKEIVAADQRLAAALEATGTPTFMVNGRKLVGAKPFADFKTVIDEELKKADDLVKAGTPLAMVSRKLTDQALATIMPNGPAPGAPTAPEPPEYVADVKVGSAPTKGPANAPVTIIEFSEFQCPFCGKVEPTVKQIEDEYKGKVRFAFRNLPLKFHQYAQTASEAALAAHEQGKFWAFHDKLYSNQDKLDRLTIDQYAKDLNLDLRKFKTSLDSGKFKGQIDEDGREAERTKTTSTPTFFINGHRLIGTQPYGAFKRVIDEELKKRAG